MEDTGWLGSAAKISTQASYAYFMENSHVQGFCNKRGEIPYVSSWNITEVSTLPSVLCTLREENQIDCLYTLKGRQAKCTADRREWMQMFQLPHLKAELNQMWEIYDDGRFQVSLTTLEIKFLKSLNGFHFRGGINCLSETAVLGEKKD